MHHDALASCHLIPVGETELFFQGNHFFINVVCCMCQVRWQHQGYDTGQIPWISSVSWGHYFALSSSDLKAATNNSWVLLCVWLSCWGKYSSLPRLVKDTWLSVTLVSRGPLIRWSPAGLQGLRKLSWFALPANTKPCWTIAALKERPQNRQMQSWEGL